MKSKWQQLHLGNIVNWHLFPSLGACFWNKIQVTKSNFSYLAFTRLSLDILASMSAVSTNSIDCLSKIVEIA